MEAANDPYAFDDETETAPSNELRFGSAPVKAAPSPSGSTGSSAYKFKSALLSRGEGGSSATPSPDLVPLRDPNKVLAPLVPLNSKPVPLRFENLVEGDFVDECARFIDDLLTKPIHVSTKPSMAQWREAMDAKAEKKAEKKKAKELRKELAVEKAAALEAAKQALENQPEQPQELPPPPQLTPTATNLNDSADPENVPLKSIKKTSPKKQHDQSKTSDLIKLSGRFSKKYLNLMNL